MEPVRLEVATAGDPTTALIGAAQTFIRRGQIWSVGIAHDDGCPSIDGAGILGCTCEIIEVIGERLT